MISHNFVQDKRSECRILVAKPEGKRQLKRPTRRLEEKAAIFVLREIGWEMGTG
jgi:hypothetical protein